MKTEDIIKTPNFKGEFLQLLAQELISKMMQDCKNDPYEDVARALTLATGDGWNHNEICRMMDSGEQLDFKSFGIIAASFGYDVNIELTPIKLEG